MPDQKPPAQATRTDDGLVGEEALFLGHFLLGQQKKMTRRDSGRKLLISDDQNTQPALSIQLRKLLGSWVCLGGSRLAPLLP